MNWKPDRYGGLRALLRRRSVDDEVLEEIQHHIAERTAANIARGMSAEAAREEALRRFGDVWRVAQETIEIDESLLREQKRMELFDTLRRELTHSVRMLLRAPVFTMVAIVTLALGIGASTAIYTLLKNVVLDPLPYPAAERLVLIDHEVPGIGVGAAWGLSSGSYFHFRQQSRTLEQVAVIWANPANLRADDAAIRGTAVAVSGNALSMLGARAAAGRLITESDDHPQAPQVAVLSHEFWQTQFGGATEAIGRTIDINGNATEIVGVLERGFHLPEQKADVVVARRLNPAGPHFNSHYMVGIGRMKPETTLASVRAELSELTRALPESYPSAYSGSFMSDSKFTTRVRDLRESIVGDLSRVLWILLGSAAVVLLIACANVANLFLVRAESQRGEQAVRSALGASRGHIFLQALSESLLLAIVAGVLGVWISYAGLKVLIAMAPSSLPRVDEITLSTPSVLLGLGLAVIAGLVFAVFPLLRRRVDYAPLREGGRGLTASRLQIRARSVLVTAQIALAVVLLASAGLMLRSFQAMRHLDLGVRPENVLTLTVSLPYTTYDTQEKAATYWRQLNDALATLPGVVSVGGTTHVPPLGSGCAIMTVTPTTTSPDRLGCIPNMIVTPGFFDAAGIAVSGRQPTWDDIDRETGAVVISRALAERLWPGEDPIGRGLKVPQGGGRYYTIVGVASDIRAGGVREPVTQLVYYPVREIEGAPLWGPVSNLALMIRTSGSDPEQLVPAVRSAIRSLDPSAAVGDIATFERIVANAMVQTTFTTVLLGIAGIMALVLSIVGLYGVVAYTVNRRRTEIGVRMALGARATEVAQLIVLQSMQLGAIGVIIGLIGAALTTRLLSSLLFGVKPTDPVTLLTVAILLLVIAALASFIPARRAAAVQPLETLRN